MHFTDRIQEAARLAAEKKLQELAIHPLVKGGCSRDVRDAYFQGLVFAAIADDDKIDGNELELLKEIGSALEMPCEEIEDAIKGVLSLDDDGKIALVEECVAALKGNKIGVKLFYAQFIQIWTSHEHDDEELSSYLRQFAEWTGMKIPKETCQDVLRVIENPDGVDGSLYNLSEWMGEAALRYFAVKRHGDVLERLAKERKKKKDKESRKREKARLEAVRSEFAAAIETISEEHKDEASLRTGWQDCLREGLSKFSPKDFDWSKECGSRLNALRRESHCYSNSVGWREKRTRRKIVWKILCMYFVLGGEAAFAPQKKKCGILLTHTITFIPVVAEIDELLAAAGRLSSEGYYKKITDFVKEHFSSVVSLEDCE